MKAGKKDEEKRKVAYILPAEICEKLKKSAIENNHSIKDELILILRKYFDGSLVELYTMVKKTVAIYAETKDFTITEAVNYLATTKISAIEEMEDTVIEKANKDYEAAISDIKKDNAI